MATFPSKVNYATGDILTATNMNDVGGAINLLNGAQSSAGKNVVLNSNFSNWQRGTSGTANSFTAGAGYNADRWQNSASGTAITVSRQTTSDTTNLPFIQYCARVQRNSGQTSLSANVMAQTIETINSIPFAGKAAVLTFYARAGANFSSTSNALSATIYYGTGTDQNVLTGFTGVGNVSTGTATLTTTWQRFTFTGTVPTTATQLGIDFRYTPTGTAGTNDYFEVTGVQLEQANTASPYAPNSTTYQGELAACQRYYFDSREAGTTNQPFNGYSNSNDILLSNVRYPVTMRTTPSITIGQSSGSNYVRRISTNAQLAITVTSYPGTAPTGFSAVYCSAAPFVAAVGYDFYILASAEL